MSEKRKTQFIRILIIICIIILGADTIYKTIYGISYSNRERCFIYQNLPRWAFLFYEYFIELSLMIIVGVYVAVLLEKYFKRFNKFYPNNQFTAFLYASVLPVCSCSVIPMMGTLNKKLKTRTLITFVLSAPLLNPYIIILSFTVLGVQYAVLRIILSFFIALTLGRIIETFSNKYDFKIDNLLACKPQKNGCTVMNNNIYSKTHGILKKIFPYIIIAAFLGYGIELLNPAAFVKHNFPENNLLGTFLIILVALPVYFCNGADIIFLQPLVNYAGLSIGSALAFSLASNAICISSFIMLSKFIGIKNSIIITLGLLFMILILCFLISSFL